MSSGIWRLESLERGQDHAQKPLHRREVIVLRRHTLPLAQRAEQIEVGGIGRVQCVDADLRVPVRVLREALRGVPLDVGEA